MSESQSIDPWAPREGEPGTMPFRDWEDMPEEERPPAWYMRVGCAPLRKVFDLYTHGQNRERAAVTVDIGRGRPYVRRHVHAITGVTPGDALVIDRDAWQSYRDGRRGVRHG